MSETKSNGSGRSNLNGHKVSVTSSGMNPPPRKTSFMSVMSDASQQSSEGNQSTSQPKLGSKFAMWGRRVSKMVSVRRKLSYNSRVPEMVDEDENNDSDSFIQKIDDSDIPTHPRFPATMSKEAQYSYLKCYENLILHQLKKSNLPRVSSGSLVSKPYIRLEKDQYINLEPKFQIKDEHFIPHSTNIKAESAALPTISQQLSTSYRLQNAMDILDCLKTINGRTPFTRRYERHAINPVKDFNHWKSIWINDFEIRSKG